MFMHSCFKHPDLEKTGRKQTIQDVQFRLAAIQSNPVQSDWFYS